MRPRLLKTQNSRWIGRRLRSSPAMRKALRPNPNKHRISCCTSAYPSGDGSGRQAIPCPASRTEPAAVKCVLLETAPMEIVAITMTKTAHRSALITVRAFFIVVPHGSWHQKRGNWKDISWCKRTTPLRPLGLILICLNGLGSGKKRRHARPSLREGKGSGNATKLQKISIHINTNAISKKSDSAQRQTSASCALQPMHRIILN